jgi:hypothetical protein
MITIIIEPPMNPTIRKPILANGEFATFSGVIPDDGFIFLGSSFAALTVFFLLSIL